MKKISLPGYFTKHFFIRAILEIFEDYPEYFYDDIILDRYMRFIKAIAPIRTDIFSFDDEYDMQRERDSWYY